MPENAADPTPVDRHPLGGLALARHAGSIYLTNGLNQGAPGGHPNDTWRFDIESAKWRQVSDAKAAVNRRRSTPGCRR